MTESCTARLALPLLVPGQAQKEMFHNEALALLDLAVGASVEAIGALVPPASPDPGQCWVLGADPEGEWEGHGGALAGWTDGGWRFVAAREGMTVWRRDVAQFAAFTAGGWQSGALRGCVFVDGVQVVGPQAEAIADPAGGASVDPEARAAIVAVLAALRGHGLIAPPNL